MRLGAALRDIRESQRKTLREIADKANLSVSQLSKLERGDRGLDIEDFVNVARALGQEPGDLLPNSAGMHAEFIPMLTRLRTINEGERPQILRAVDVIIDVHDNAFRAGRRDNVVKFTARSSIRITLSDDDRDELAEAIAATGKLAPRKVGRSDIPVPMLGTVAASPDGRGISFTRTNETRDINKYHWDHGVRYVFSVAGESMADMYIRPGDLLYIRPTAEPVEDRPIVCFVGNDLYVKKFFRRSDGGITLRSENKALGYPDIEINPEEVETRFNYLGEVFGRYGDL